MNAQVLTDVEEAAKVFVPENICFKFKVDDIRNVPVPKRSAQRRDEEPSGFSLDDVESRELRIILFDLQKNEYVSNAHVIPASASEDGKTWYFGAVSESIKLAAEVTFKNDPARASRGGKQQEKPEVHVIFELVLSLKKKPGEGHGAKQGGQTLQVTNGWGIKALKELQGRTDDKPIRVMLHGGSPANEVEIDQSQVEDKNVKKKAGGLAALFRQTRAEEEPSSFFIEITASPL